MKRLGLSVFLLLLPFMAFAQSGLDTLQLDTIFAEPYLPGKRPAFEAFMPGNEGLYFTWNDSAYSKNEHSKLSWKKAEAQPVSENYESNFTVSPDRKQVAYIREGDLWIANADFSDARRIVESPDREYDVTWSPDGNKLAYVRDGNIWIAQLDPAKITQLTQQKEDDPGYNVGTWADNNTLVLRQYDTSDYKEYFFPEYVHEYVEPGKTRRGIPRQVVSVAYLDSSKIKQLYAGDGYLETDVSTDGKYVAIDRLDPPMKHRHVDVYSLDDPKPQATEVFTDSTDGWIYYIGVEFAPSGHRLLLHSEKSGWNHLYTVNPDGSDLKQLTEGSYEVPWSRWLDDQHILFASTKVDPGERHLYRLNLKNGKTEKLTTDTGFRQNFHLSENDRYVVYEKTYFNEPEELYLFDLKKAGNGEKRLTHSVPERFQNIDWQKPEYMRFTGRDGETKISMTFLPPFNREAGKKYPLVVFVHGAGSLQNVFKGWSNHYWREYMFNQWLNEHGYAVMQVDYRHSTGYGRKFREDVTGWMGKYETHDIVDGIKHIADRAYVDTSRVGVYGGSYGGFMALYTVSAAPEYFDAAAALRSVTNWENYYHTNPWYTLPRLGTPEKDSVNYARSSPITYADSLSRPILLLHGLMDNNVGFQDAAQYIERLIQTDNKHFRMMMYPSERHSFDDPDSWQDEYRRIYEFFEEKLK